MRRPRLLLSAALAILALAAGLPAPASAATTFTAGARYDGEFADPAIMRVGGTYYAYATLTGGDNLPAASSGDLANWRLRPAYPAGANPGWWAGYNDALPHPARWARYDAVRNGRRFTRPWAPSVARIGARYVLAYSVPVGTNPNRRCISVATAAAPFGPFVDSSRRPIVCSSDPNGSNDPYLFVDGRTPYLLWKNTGVPGRAPTRIWIRRLAASGTAFAPGAPARALLATAQRWEGTVIENPAMIRYAGRYYLLYSANRYDTAAYAVGYAICTSALGRCRRPSTRPLLATGGGVAGPGGPAPVVGPGGALRLGYAAFDAGRVGYSAPGQYRRLHVARLAVSRTGALAVVSRG